MSGGGDETGGSHGAAQEPAKASQCRLRKLPIELVVRIWPAQRVVMAGRTSRWLRQAVVPRCVACLHGSSSASEEHFSPESVAHSLSLVGGAEVKWEGPRGRVLLRGIQRARAEGFTGIISAVILEGSWMEDADIPVVERTDVDPDWWTEDFEQVLEAAQLLTKTLSHCSSNLVHLSLTLSAGALGKRVLTASGAALNHNPFDLVWRGFRRTANEQEEDADFLKPLRDCTKLRHLRLSAVWLGPAIEQSDSPILSAHVLGALTHLELSCFHESGSHLGMEEPENPAAYELVLHEMPQNCALETLYMGYVGLGYCGIDPVLQLGGKCPRLRRLDVRGGVICTKAGDFVRSLACCEHLTGLNFSDNWMDERVSRDLAASIGALRRLRSLNLSANGFGYIRAEDEQEDEPEDLPVRGRPCPGMAALAEALSTHPTLQAVDLSDNEFESAVKETVARQLEGLPTLRI